MPMGKAVTSVCLVASARSYSHAHFRSRPHLSSWNLLSLRYKRRSFEANWVGQGYSDFYSITACCPRGKTSEQHAGGTKRITLRHVAGDVGHHRDAEAPDSHNALSHHSLSVGGHTHPSEVGVHCHMACEWDPCIIRNI